MNESFPQNHGEEANLLRLKARNPPVGLSSPALAIKSARATSESYLESLGFGRFIGKNVESVDFDSGCLCCTLNESAPLSIHATPTGIALDLDQRIHTGIHRPLLDLELGTRRWTWNRGAIANQLVGQQIKNGFYAGLEFYLYLENRKAISFCSFINAASQDPFLYCDFAT